MESVNPKVMHIFPGQGSQYVGMGSDIYKEFSVVRDVYERAGDALGFDIAKLSFEGPKEQLDKTEYTQPALLTHSVACLEAFKAMTGNQWPAEFVAGHSLGEYSALVAAEALTLEQAVGLVRQRGRYMSDYGRGKMVAFRLTSSRSVPWPRRTTAALAVATSPIRRSSAGSRTTWTNWSTRWWRNSARRRPGAS